MITLLSKNQIERLKPLETYLRTSYYQNYKRATTKSENELLATVYFEATQKQLNGWSCGTCCLKNYQTAAKMYFDSIDELNKCAVAASNDEGNTNMPSTEESATESNKTTNKRVGRPRKTIE